MGTGLPRAVHGRVCSLKGQGHAVIRPLSYGGPRGRRRALPGPAGASPLHTSVPLNPKHPLLQSPSSRPQCLGVRGSWHTRPSARGPANGKVRAVAFAPRCPDPTVSYSCYMTFQRLSLHQPQEVAFHFRVGMGEGLLPPAPQHSPPHPAPSARTAPPRPLGGDRPVLGRRMCLPP